MANMSDEEFIEMYGRPPVRVKKRRYKVYWNRVIIALVILILIIAGLVQLVKTIVRSFSDDDGGKGKKALPAGADQSVSQTDPQDSEAAPVKEVTQLQFKVCIDAGHGGEDGGTATADGSRLEKDDNLRIALAVKDYLESKGVTVVMTRNDDTFLGLQERCDIANAAQADLFVSLHRNSYDGEMSGVEIWVHNSEPQYDTLLAQNILTRLENVGIADNRGVQSGYIGMPDANYHVNSETDMPSCLVELGFITTDSDNQLFDSNFTAYTQAIGDGIIETAFQLKVIDEDGKRIMDHMLLSDGKNNGSTQTDSSGVDQQGAAEEGVSGGDTAAAQG